MNNGQQDIAVLERGDTQEADTNENQPLLDTAKPDSDKQGISSDNLVGAETGQEGVPPLADQSPKPLTAASSDNKPSIHKNINLDGVSFDRLVDVIYKKHVDLISPTAPVNDKNFQTDLLALSILQAQKVFAKVNYKVVLDIQTLTGYNDIKGDAFTNAVAMSSSSLMKSLGGASRTSIAATAISKNLQAGKDDEKLLKYFTHVSNIRPHEAYSYPYYGNVTKEPLIHEIVANAKAVINAPEPVKTSEPVVVTDAKADESELPKTSEPLAASAKPGIEVKFKKGELYLSLVSKNDTDTVVLKMYKVIDKDDVACFETKDGKKYYVTTDGKGKHKLFDSPNFENIVKVISAEPKGDVTYFRLMEDGRNEIVKTKFSFYPNDAGNLYVQSEFLGHKNSYEIEPLEKGSNVFGLFKDFANGSDVILYKKDRQWFKKVAGNGLNEDVEITKEKEYVLEVPGCYYEQGAINKILFALAPRQIADANLPQAKSAVDGKIVQSTKTPSSSLTPEPVSGTLQSSDVPVAVDSEQSRSTTSSPPVPTSDSDPVPTSDPVLTSDPTKLEDSATSSTPIPIPVPTKPIVTVPPPTLDMKAEIGKITNLIVYGSKPEEKEKKNTFAARVIIAAKKDVDISSLQTQISNGLTEKIMQELNKDQNSAFAKKISEMVKDDTDGKKKQEFASRVIQAFNGISFDGSAKFNYVGYRNGGSLVKSIIECLYGLIISPFDFGASFSKWYNSNSEMKILDAEKFKKAFDTKIKIDEVDTAPLDAILKKLAARENGAAIAG